MILDYMDKLTEWQKDGNRSVKIEITKTGVDVFVYDYDYSNGFIIENIKDLPTVEVFKKAAIKQKLDLLNEIKEMEEA